MHRSGTSILFKCLKKHPRISGFDDTGVSENEGQLLQTIYPAAKEYGGPGKFGFKKEMHLTESSDLINEENKKRLFKEWSQHWDLEKEILLEKSPPNLIKTRFLQSLFPNSTFVTITRHPIAVAFATKSFIDKKWKKARVELFIKHWIVCHEIYFHDKILLNNVIDMKYEHFVLEPNVHLERIYKKIGIETYTSKLEIKKTTNKKYYSKWNDYSNNLWTKNYYNKIIDKYENKINQFGYSLIDF